MTVFQYHADVLERYPTIRGGIILAKNLHNGITPSDLATSYQAEQEAVKTRIGETPLAEVETLAAWRRAFSAFGVKPTQYRSAAEALLRRLTKKGDIPNLNLLVDMGNLVSIRYGMPVAFMDRRDVQGAITVCFAEGHENFTDLGASEIVHPEPGEVIFVDEADTIFARRWCWRQSAQSASREDTNEVLITIEGLHDNAENDVQSAMDDVEKLFAQFQPEATLQMALLSPARPAFGL